MEKSTFMRSYFRSAHEDPIWELIHKNSDCEEVYNARLTKEENFGAILMKNTPELYSIYDDLISSIYRFEKVLFEEFYILGVQDREQSLVRQE